MYIVNEKVFKDNLLIYNRFLWGIWRTDLSSVGRAFDCSCFRCNQNVAGSIPAGRKYKNFY
jgi:hypothetical protein